ncbi:dihydrofolate reductase family protein [Aquipuribacter hungaricus]|uniref:Dihydrofolate reductase family protein n=1 Tax=Aquipuribacter hungaricus TaxID=545624 RepID=A0ABV7WFU9_9MICO
MEALLGAPTGVLPAAPDEAARALAARYAYPSSVAEGRPWVRANTATSLDGAVSGADGRSASVSGTVDKQVFGVLRGLADVVLVGAGTARTEGYGPVRPHRVLGPERARAGRRTAAVLVQVTRSGRVEAGRGMFDEPGAALVAVPGGDEAARARAVGTAGEDRVLVCGGGDHGGTDRGGTDHGGVDLADLLDRLARRGLTRVLCEGGPELLGALAAADLLDELCLTTSPVLVAGDGARAVTGAAGDPRGFSLAGLLHAEGTLLARWVRDRGTVPDEQDA